MTRFYIRAVERAVIKGGTTRVPFGARFSWCRVLSPIESRKKIIEAAFAFLVALLSLPGWCNETTVNHAFEFNAIRDSPEIQVLDFRYGDSSLPGASNPDRLRVEGRSLQGTSVQGPMRLGESLYVKWRIRATGEVREDTVDLRGRLTGDLTGHQLYFIVHPGQLYVFLITPNRRSTQDPVLGPNAYQHLRVFQIYPD